MANVVGDDFNIPRSPGNETEVSPLLLFGLLGSCVSEESSWMSGGLDELIFVVIGADSGVDLITPELSSDRDGGETTEAGTWTIRDRSFPFEAILGVLMERESVRPVCASIRCRESSRQGDEVRLQSKDDKGHTPTRKNLNSGSRKVRDFTDVWNTQSNTIDALPAE